MRGAALVPQSCFTIVQIESKLLTLMPQPFGYKCGQQALCLFPFSGNHCLEGHAVEVCGDGTTRRKFVGLGGGVEQENESRGLIKYLVFVVFVCLLAWLFGGGVGSVHFTLVWKDREKENQKSVLILGHVLPRNGNSACFYLGPMLFLIACLNSFLV